MTPASKPLTLAALERRLKTLQGERLRYVKDREKAEALYADAEDALTDVDKDSAKVHQEIKGWLGIV